MEASKQCGADGDTTEMKRLVPLSYNDCQSPMFALVKATTEVTGRGFNAKKRDLHRRVNASQLELDRAKRYLNSLTERVGNDGRAHFVSLEQRHGNELLVQRLERTSGLWSIVKHFAQL